MTPAKKKIRILLVDDHFVVRTGLASALNSAEDMQVVAEAEQGSEAIESYTRVHPDVVVMDLRLPDLSGIEATREICRRHPGAHVVTLSSYEGDEEIYQALQAGALAYLSKRAGREELLRAIRAAHAGQKYLPPAVAQSLAEHLPREPLTERELEVLRLAAAGQSNKLIADRLSITEGTVKLHMSSILSKLHAQDRTHAVTTALRRGIIRLE